MICIYWYWFTTHKDYCTDPNILVSVLLPWLKNMNTVPIINWHCYCRIHVYKKWIHRITYAMCLCFAQSYNEHGQSGPTATWHGRTATEIYTKFWGSCSTWRAQRGDRQSCSSWQVPLWNIKVSLILGVVLILYKYAQL